MRTPTTLKQAIMDGLLESVAEYRRLKQVEPFDAEKAQAMQLHIIEAHILDFFRQKFGVAYLQLSEWAVDHVNGKDPGEILRLLAESTGVTNEKMHALRTQASTGSTEKDRRRAG